MDSCGSGYGPATDCCEEANETSGSIKCATSLSIQLTVSLQLQVVCGWTWFRSVSVRRCSSAGNRIAASQSHPTRPNPQQDHSSNHKPLYKLAMQLITNAASLPVAPQSHLHTRRHIECRQQAECRSTAALRELCSLEILVWARSLRSFFLVILSHDLSFICSTRVQAMESSRQGRGFSVRWSVETGSADHIIYCVVVSEGSLAGLNPLRRATNQKPPFCVNVRNVYSCMSPRPYFLMTRCSRKHINKLTFTITQYLRVISSLSTIIINLNYIYIYPVRTAQ